MTVPGVCGVGVAGRNEEKVKYLDVPRVQATHKLSISAGSQTVAPFAGQQPLSNSGHDKSELKLSVFRIRLAETMHDLSSIWCSRREIEIRLSTKLSNVR
jgi:hypothetical protein